MEDILFKTIKPHKKHYFLMQGSILAFSGIIVRIIGLFYRIPMINIIGTKGNGYYTSAYSVYSLFLILSSYSFPIAISKIVSQRLALGRFKDVKNVIRASFVIALLVGIFMFSLMFFGADFISKIYRKPLLKFALKALAPTLFIMSFLGIFRGLFQGMGNMVPTAISQIFEQITNAITSIVFAYILFDRGKIANLIYESEEYSYAFGARGGAIGTGLGAFIALSILFFMFLNLLSKYKKLLNNNNYYEPESRSKIFSVLYYTMVPIIISGTIYNLTTVLDDLIFSNVLTIMKSNLNIVVLWGVFGNYHLLFNIPVAVANSLTSSIIPSISRSAEQNNIKEVVLKVKYSVKYTMLIVIPSFVGLIVLADSICNVLFREHVDMLIKMLRVGSIAVVFFSLSTVTIGILQGLGYYNIPLKNSVIALGIHIVACLIFLIPLKLNIYGIVFGMIVFASVLWGLNQKALNRIVKYKNSRAKGRYVITYVKMILSAVIMGVLTNILNNILSMSIMPQTNYFALVLRLIICIVFAVIVYGTCIIMFGVVRKSDSDYIPFISRFEFLLRG